MGLSVRLGHAYVTHKNELIDALGIVRERARKGVPVNESWHELYPAAVYFAEDDKPRIAPDNKRCSVRDEIELRCILPQHHDGACAFVRPKE